MSLAPLIACAGEWRGTNRLHDPHRGVPDETSSTLTITPLLAGTFVRLAYTWSYEGRPQQGELLVGLRSKAAVATVHWIDTWHMGAAVLACEGAAVAGGTIAVRGAYAVPGHPDWGWTIEIRPAGGQTLHVVMHNVSPEGQAVPAVEGVYVPV